MCIRDRCRYNTSSMYLIAGQLKALRLVGIALRKKVSTLEQPSLRGWLELIAANGARWGNGAYLPSLTCTLLPFPFSFLFCVSIQSLYPLTSSFCYSPILI